MLEDGLKIRFAKTCEEWLLERVEPDYPNCAFYADLSQLAAFLHLYASEARVKLLMEEVAKMSE